MTVAPTLSELSNRVSSAEAAEPPYRHPSAPLSEAEIAEAIGQYIALGEPGRLADRQRIQAAQIRKGELQAELAKMQAEMASLAAAESEARQRHDALSEGSDNAARVKASVELETTLQAIRRLRGPLAEKIVRQQLLVNECGDRSRLAATASPRLHAERYSIERRLQAASRRLEVAQAELNQFAPVLVDALTRKVRPVEHGWQKTSAGTKKEVDLQRVAHFGRRTLQAQTELVAAAQEVDELQRLLRDNHAQAMGD